MFKRISLTIALQFSVYVFLFFLVNGLIFLAVDFQNARRQTHDRLLRNANTVMALAVQGPNIVPNTLPRPLRESLRIADVSGNALFAGEMFDNLPFEPTRDFFHTRMNGEDYTVLTLPVKRGEELVGYLQILDVERFQSHDLPRRAIIYLVISLAVSTTTFFVGLYFAKRSLAPAEEMVERLEQFTQDASHELRTPLAALRSSLDLALKTKKYEEGIVSALDDVTNITQLVERLLELARIDQFALIPEVVDMSGLVQQVVEKHQSLAQEKGLTLEGRVSPSVCVQGDAALLRQLLTNLIGNAIKFTPPQGRVTVHLQPQKLIVEDTGIGIAATDIPHLFDRFFQADASRTQGGYGLGLALVQRIVDLHRWSIDVRSVRAQGTSFAIALKAKKNT